MGIIDWWKTKPFWLKGGIIGLIIGIAIISLFITLSINGKLNDTPKDLISKCSSNTVWDCEFDPILAGGHCGCTTLEQNFRLVFIPAIPLITLSYIFVFYVNVPLELISILLSYLIIGIAVGLIIGKIKSKQ
jgi:ABC-type antimicrobial peptide transport system permease subunit